MRYAFVTVSIIAVWAASIALALWTTVNTLFLVTLALVMTVVLFFIGFGKRQK